MKTIITIILAFSVCVIFAQTQATEKYLMPENDTMDVIVIANKDIGKFTMNVGKYSRIEPIPVDTLKPTEDYFLPARCLYDKDMKSIKNLLNELNKCYLKISQKRVIAKPISEMLIIIP